MENERALKTSDKSLASLSPMIYLILGFALAVMITFMIVRPVTRFESPAPSSWRLDQEFGSPADGFSLRYPSGWSKMGQSELGRLKNAFSFAAKRNNPRAFFSVRAQKVNAKNVNLNQLAVTLEKTMSKRFDGFQKFDQTIISLSDGRQALRYEYSFKADGGSRVHEQLTIVLGQTKAYHLIASATERNFDAVRGELEEMIQSFKTL